MSRGNGGGDIFLHDADRRRFLELVRHFKMRMGFRIYAYCLMSNHIHLLIRVGNLGLPQIMQRILTRYAKHFNQARDRKGHLFQSRYKAIPCARDDYFHTLLRYVHLNPVDAGLADRPELWPWSGHGELLGVPGNGLVDADFPLSTFSAEPDRARVLYERFILEGMGKDLELPNQEPAGVKRLEPNPMERIPERDSDEEILRRLAAALEKETGVGLETLRIPGRRQDLTAARNLLIERALAQGLGNAVIARFLHRAPSCVWRACLD